jgi:hypothetical protein
MLAALQNVRPSHLLDARLWKTLGIAAASEEAGAPPEEDRVLPPSSLVREVPTD